MVDFRDLDTGYTILAKNTTGAHEPLTLQWLLSDWVRYRHPASDEVMASDTARLLDKLNRYTTL